MVLSQALVDFLKMPSALMSTQTCWSSALFNDTLRTYSHWNVYVKNLKGLYNGVAHSELLAKVRDDLRRGAQPSKRCTKSASKCFARVNIWSDRYRLYGK